MANIAITLGGVVLPVVKIEDLKEIPSPIESSNITLDGTLYTDFVSLRRSWQIHWPILTEDEYDDIRAIFNAQYTNEAYPLLQIPYYGISHPAKMSINEKNIKWDGNCIRDFSVVLEEQYAVS